MQEISIATTDQQKQHGGRISSARFRKSSKQSDDFTGLEEGANRYDLLLLVKRVGKQAGFTSKMIALLDYYMAYTRDCDWEEGSRPIVYKSLSQTSLDLGVSERQIQNLEKALFEVGALTWRDNGNHRRTGQRDAETGRIVYAYGVDLTPLAYLKPELENKLHEKQLHDQAWQEAKRQISFYRRQTKALIAELESIETGRRGQINTTIDELNTAYDALHIQIRTHLKLDELRSRLKKQKALYEQALAVVEELNPSPKTEKTSPQNEENFAHLESTNQQPSDKSDTRKTSSSRIRVRRKIASAGKTKPLAPSPTKQPLDYEDLRLKAGLQHIELKHALKAASPNFLEHLPIPSPNTTWNDLVEAAYRLKTNLGISQQSWSEACEILGKNGAAICVLLTERGTLRKTDPITCPSAYIKSMVARARKGRLFLHKSVCGLLHGV